VVVKTFVLLTPEGKGIYGELDASGVVTFIIEAGPGSSIRGTELFNRMMQSFGAGAVAIHGIWRKAPPGQPSTNLDKVNELTAAGMPVEDAIQHAWTVTRAQKIGFTKVRLLGNLVGMPGAYTQIEVLLEK
jgi:hypothetical protein